MSAIEASAAARSSSEQPLQATETRGARVARRARGARLSKRMEAKAAAKRMQHQSRTIMPPTLTVEATALAAT